MEMLWPDIFLKDWSDIWLITNEKSIFFPAFLPVKYLFMSFDVIFNLMFFVL